MKELIGINKQEVSTLIEKVLEVVKIINENSDTFNKKNYKVSINDIRLMIYDTDIIKNSVYHRELEEVCEMFGEDYNKVRTKEYTIMVSDMFHKMALKRCGWLLDIAEELRHLSYYGDNIFINYIEINENVASPKLNFEEDIKEYYSHYALNDKQTKLTKKLKAIQKDIQEVINMGFTCGEVRNFLNAWTNDIYYDKVEQY